MKILSELKQVASALYVPGSNARALEKAHGLDADMLIIDLEDAVPAAQKAEARTAAIAATQHGFPGKRVALRLNAMGSAEVAEDIVAVQAAVVDMVVLPKIEDVAGLDAFFGRVNLPILAMIEGPKGLYAARDIAAHPSVVGLIAGANDICAEMGINPGPSREGLELSLQMIVMAAAAAGKPAFDGVCNRLDDMSGFEAECRQGRCYGFTGKTLIHPNQVAIANRSFGPDAQEYADALLLVKAATGGAQRFQGRMIESMHVEEARRIIARARHYNQAELLSGA